jgi:hypothetical protein
VGEQVAAKIMYSKNAFVNFMHYGTENKNLFQYCTFSNC